MTLKRKSRREEGLASGPWAECEEGGVFFLLPHRAIILARDDARMMQTTVLNSNPALSLVKSFLGEVASSLWAEGIALRQCPARVARTIKSQMGLGRIDGIQSVRADRKKVYLAEIDLPDDVDLLLVISENGEILRRREEGDF